MKSWATFLVILAVSLPATVFAGWFGPSSYEDCLLENMKGAQSEIAAKAIHDSCRQKFPLPENLPDYCLDKLSGETKVSSGYFYGTIHNGCHDWLISSVQLLIQHELEPKDESKLEDLLVAQNPELFGISPDEYTIKIEIPPLDSAKYKVPINWDSSKRYKWKIKSAKGYKNIN